jgi:hypothetical protein
LRRSTRAPGHPQSSNTQRGSKPQDITAFTAELARWDGIVMHEGAPETNRIAKMKTIALKINSMKIAIICQPI